MTKDIDNLLDQLDHVKALSVEEQEKWAVENISPLVEAFQGVGVAIEEMMQSAFVYLSPIFQETVKWYEDNKIVIDKAIADER